MSDISRYNTFLTDLEVGDYVYESNRDGRRYLSTVKSIDSDKIVVTRPTNTDHAYFITSGRSTPYEFMASGWFLEQYIDPAIGTPFSPGSVASDAESLLPSNYYGDESGD